MHTLACRATSRRLRWLHRIGYGTTVLIAAEMLFVAGAIAVETYQRHQRAEVRRSLTAYRHGPFREARWLLADLAALPPAEALAPDGLRIVARPELQFRNYAVALQLRPGEPTASGTLNIHDDFPGKERRTSFPIHLSAAAYRQLVNDTDRKLDGFSGSPAYLLDGTSVAVERVRGGRLTSGGSNDGPYPSVGDDVLAALRRANPALPLPPSGRHWYQPDG